jgi:two-component system, response regulator PdtaR
MPDRKNVLIVEDDPLQRMMAGDLAEESGLTPVFAGDADQAIVILESRADISLVMTDVEMPGSMNGIKLVQVIRRRWPPIELLVVSGNVLRETVDLPERSRFINKPYPPDQLIRTLRTLAFC